MPFEKPLQVPVSSRVAPNLIQAVAHIFKGIFCSGLVLRWAKAFDWRPALLRVPRGYCHWVRISIRGLDRRQIPSSLRLQLINLTGITQLGFAWKAAGEQADIWYWDERETSLLATLAAGLSGAEERLRKPCPEMLFRAPLTDGLRLIHCDEGVEALATIGGGLVQTRWFPRMPDEASWAGFVRDAGQAIAAYPLPDVVSLPSNEKPEAGWRLQSSWAKSLRGKAQLALVAVFVSGLVVAICVAYDLKLGYLIRQKQNALAVLTQEKGKIIELQNQISNRTALLDTVSGARPKVLQLRLMQALVDTGLFGEETKISLVEWEYRNDRLRLLFSVPPQGFSQGLLLTTLEKSNIFGDIRLMSDSPPGTVGIQAEVLELPVPVRGPAVQGEDVAITPARAAN